AVFMSDFVPRELWYLHSIMQTWLSFFATTSTS
ncbi:unnamed protein product, partial [marine sediment metagenome]